MKIKHFSTRLLLAVLLFNQVQAQTSICLVDPRIGNVGAILEPTRPTVQHGGLILSFRGI